MTEFRSLLRSRLRDVHQLSDFEAELLEGHYFLLERWNRRLNLTSLTLIDEVVERHYCESVFLACSLPTSVRSVIDVGSGAGFPGFPFAVLRPQCTVTLVESNGKKAVFLREASRKISNVRVTAERAESVIGEAEWIVSRAVRWEDITKLLPKLSRRVGLLLGDADAAQASACPHIEWSKPLRVPWGARRVLLLGEVPRGTSTSD